MLENITGIQNAPDFKTFMIMGTPGGGKTTIAGTFPKPLLVIDIKNASGAQVLKNKYKQGDVDFVSISSKPGSSVYQQLRDTLKELTTKEYKYKSVLIDPITSVPEDLEQAAMAAKRGVALNFDEYKSINKMILDLREDIQRASLKYNMILNAHIKYKEDSDRIDGEITNKIIPKTTYNNGNNLIETCQVVIYTTKKTVISADGKTKNIKFVSFIGSHPNIPGLKVQMGTNLVEIGSWVENLTYDKLISIINGGKINATSVVEQKTGNPFDTDGKEE